MRVKVSTSPFIPINPGEEEEVEDVVATPFAGPTKRKRVIPSTAGDEDEVAEKEGEERRERYMTILTQWQLSPELNMVPFEDITLKGQAYYSYLEFN